MKAFHLEVQHMTFTIKQQVFLINQDCITLTLNLVMSERDN